MTVRICSIGCGNHARGAHGPALRHIAAQQPDVELAACCDLDADRAEAFRRDFAFRAAYTDMAEMLDKEKPDGVCLVAHVELTCELACRVMEMGYAVLMEKPPGMNLLQVDRLIETAERRGMAAMVAFNRRFTPLIRALRDQLDAALAPHDIQHLRYEFTRFRRYDEDFSTTAIHGIDTVRFLMRADYQSVRFTYRPYPQLGAHVANVFMDCVMDSGATASLEFCPAAGLVVERAAVQAHDHTWYLHTPIRSSPDMPGLLRHYRPGQPVEEIAGDALVDSAEVFETSGFLQENAAFIDALREGRKPEPSPAESRQSVEIMQALRERREAWEAPASSA